MTPEQKVELAVERLNRMTPEEMAARLAELTALPEAELAKRLAAAMERLRNLLGRYVEIVEDDEP